jgi:pimeloyl-ACP methyl ester carboxylesterase
MGRPVYSRTARRFCMQVRSSIWTEGAFGLPRIPSVPKLRGQGREAPHRVDQDARNVGTTDVANLRHNLFAALRRHEHLHTDAVGGLQLRLANGQRTVRDRCSDEITLVDAGGCLHGAGDSLRMGRLEIVRSSGPSTHSGWLDPGLRFTWPALAICPDAPPRDAGGRRRHVERHPAPCLRKCNGSLHVDRDRFRERFRVYSIASLAILFAFGALTFWDAPRVAANLPTPWLGIWERINIGVFLLWVVVLAIILLRAGDRVATSRPRSVFKTPAGEVAFLAAYDAAMKVWPVPYEELDLPSRFGITHVIVCGPKHAPPLVLLHGYWATSTMWSPNVDDFSRDYRVYAIDVMGQPSKSIPTEPIRNAADYAAWLTVTLDLLHLDRVSLVGMSYGAWLALNFAIVAPARVRRLVLLSPGGGFHAIAKQFTLRAMLMLWFPARFTVNSFMRWLGIKDREARQEGDMIVDLIYLGLKHFRVSVETSRVLPTVFPDDQLRAMCVPALLLMGDHEVIWDPAAALARARQLFPNVQGELVQRSSHDMCLRQHRIVDARVLDFLKKGHDDMEWPSVCTGDAHHEDQ